MQAVSTANIDFSLNNTFVLAGAAVQKHERLTSGSQRTLLSRLSI